MMSLLTSTVNIIIKEVRPYLGLPTPKPAPYQLRIADEVLVNPVGRQEVIINDNNIVQTILINPRIGPRLKIPKVFVCYNFAKRLTKQEGLNLKAYFKHFICISSLALAFYTNINNLIS